jgi:hypothetical protein
VHKCKDYQRRQLYKLAMRVGHNPGVVEPPADTVVWQYMDFTNLVSILERKELFFSRADNFDDPYEGRISDFNRRKRMEVYSEANPNLPKEQLERDLAQIDSVLEEKRHKVIINSWHMNEHESAAMWELYAQRNSGIAIQTTLGRLSDSLDKANSDWISIGIVKYIDFDNEWMYEGDHIHFPFLHKRKSFEHEKELRAYTELPTEGLTEMVKNGVRSYVRDTTDPKQKTESGKYVTVDVDKLISNIYVSPRAESWIGDLVKAVVKRYGLKPDQVIVSKLYSLS